MIENVTLNIKPNDLRKILTDYYKQLYNDDNITILFKSTEELVGIYEDKELTTTVEMTRRIKIGNQIGTIRYDLSKNDIVEVLNNSLNDDNYEIEYITLKTEKEYLDDYIEFKELEATMKRKEKVKQKIKEL